MDYETPEQTNTISVHSGFPNAATDRSLNGLDLNKLLIRYPASTFLMRLSGHAWEKQGIYNDDIAIIDRSLNPKPQDLVIYWMENEFTVSRFSKLPLDTTIWGVITYIIHDERGAV